MLYVLPILPFYPMVVNCVEIKLRASHAIDATLSPWPRRLDGVEAHEGPLALGLGHAIFLRVRIT